MQKQLLKIQNVAALLLTMVNSHGILIQPMAKTLADSAANDFVATILGGQLYPGYASYRNGDPARIFDTFFQAGPYDSVKAIVDTAVEPTSCGNTESTAPPQDVTGLSGWKVQNTGNTAEGFTPSHKGPCEVWLGDTKVFWDADCATNYPGSPAEVPISYDACGESCTMTLYWLALHNEDDNDGGIQVYKNCVPISTSADAAVVVVPAGPAIVPVPATTTATVTSTAPAYC